jgi:hypothetical protein
MMAVVTHHQEHLALPRENLVCGDDCLIEWMKR